MDQPVGICLGLAPRAPPGWPHGSIASVNGVTDGRGHADRLTFTWMQEPASKEAQEDEDRMSSTRCGMSYTPMPAWLAGWCKSGALGSPHDDTRPPIVLPVVQ